VIKAAEDSALQYMHFMNAIFAAQKQVNCGLPCFRTKGLGALSE
jgi:hypothetical protein